MQPFIFHDNYSIVGTTKLLFLLLHPVVLSSDTMMEWKRILAFEKKTETMQTPMNIRNERDRYMVAAKQRNDNVSLSRIVSCIHTPNIEKNERNEYIDINGEPSRAWSKTGPARCSWWVKKKLSVQEIAWGECNQKKKTDFDCVDSKLYWWCFCICTYYVSTPM